MKYSAVKTIFKFLILAVCFIMPTTDLIAQGVPGKPNKVNTGGSSGGHKPGGVGGSAVKPVLTVNGDEFSIKLNFDAAGGTRMLDIRTNQGAPSVADMPSWMTLVGASSDEMTVRCDPNMTPYERTANFKINAGKRSVTVNVKQPSGRFTVTKCEFINTDEFSSKISGPSTRMYAPDVRFLNPVLTYNGPGKSMQKTVYVKIYDSRGHLRTTSNSSLDYTYKDVVTFFPGKDQTMVLMGLGRASESIFSVGTMRVEVFCDDEMIASGTIELY